MIEVRVQAEPFEPGAELARLEALAPGAIASFTGLVRGDDGLLAMELEHYPGMTRAAMERVVAEAVIPNEILHRVMRSDSQLMYRARQVSNLGGFMSGVNNNGSHSANGITAVFIATGQDVANVAESSAAFVFAEVQPNGDYYYSVTIPSLIVATYGGGTGLATQRECLEMLGCYGKDKVFKFAEIVAATVLCGELSLGSAIVAEEWVRAHDLLGRNRP